MNNRAKNLKPNADRRPVVSLLRVSTDEQDVERQRTINRVSARFHNVEIVREVAVVDVSGRHVNDDPQFQQIFRELKSGEIKGTVIAEQSRLVRPDDFGDLAIFDHWKHNGALIYTPTLAIDPRTPEGKQMLMMGGMMSGTELSLIKSRMMSGKDEKRKEGLYPGGNQTLPRGVKFIRTRDPQTGKTLSAKWTHDGIDSERVKKAFALLLDGDSYMTIAQKIGGGFSDVGVAGTLANPIWIGIRRYAWVCDGEEIRPISKKTGEPGKHRRRARRVEQPRDIKIDLPQLVTPEVFERAQQIIAERKIRHRKNKKPPRMLLSGLLRCACGKVMYARAGTKGHGKDSYICSSRFPRGSGCGRGFVYRADLDAAIESMIAECLLDRKFVAGVFGRVREMKKTDPNQKKRAAAILDLQESRAKIVDLYETTRTITKADLRERVTRIDREIADVERLAPKAAEKDDAGQIARWIVNLFAEFAMLDFTERRGLLQRAFKWVTIDPGEILSITFDGGFLSEKANKNAGANSRAGITASSRISSVADITLHFPRPYQIAALQVRPS